MKLNSRDVDDLRRLLSLLSNSGPGQQEADAQLLAAGENSEHLQGRARHILANRASRHDIFGKAMFGEPAWDMLLLLYVLGSGPRQTISRLADLALATKSTALRWVDYLESQGLIRRDTHPADRRAACVELTDKGRKSLELYLAGTVAPKD